MAQQLSMIPGEDELKKLCEERDELRSKLKPLFDLVKSNAQFLVKYAPFCHDVYFRNKHLKAAAANTAIAMQQADELNDAAAKLGATLLKIDDVEVSIAYLKDQINNATNGEYERQHPELWGKAPEQLDEQADELLEREGLDPETATVAPEDEADDGGYSDEGRNEDPRTAI